MKRSLEMPVADGHTDVRTDERERIYRTTVGSAGGPKKVIYFSHHHRSLLTKRILFERNSIAMQKY